MRIAVCFSGLMRTGYFASDNIKNYLGDLLPHCDFFIHTWDTHFPKLPCPSSIVKGTDIWESLNNQKPYSLTFSEINKFLNIYNPKKYEVESYNHFIDKIREKNISAERFFKPYWHSIYNSNRLKCEYENENNFKYDYVLRIRPDLLIDPRSSLREDIILCGLKSKVLLTYNGESSDVTLFLDDIYHFSNNNTMDTFCEIGNIFSPNFKNLYIREYLRQCKIKIKRINTENYTILRKISLHLNPINDYYDIMYENHLYYSPDEMIINFNKELLKKKNKLIVFGCSFTAGNPISFPDINGFSQEDNNCEYLQKYKKDENDLIWPEIVGKFLNFNVLNFACGGSSNDMILDTIIKKWNHINEGDVVIIEQSFTHRFDVINPKTNELITITPNINKFPLFNHPFDKKETENLSLASVFVSSELHKERYYNRFNFIKQRLYDTKKVKKCILWNIEDYHHKYEKIFEETNNVINEHHWSYKGHREFANKIISLCYDR